MSVSGLFIYVKHQVKQIIISKIERSLKKRKKPPTLYTVYQNDWRSLEVDYIRKYIYYTELQKPVEMKE
jgi:hypothetical protein